MTAAHVNEVTQIDLVGFPSAGLRWQGHLEDVGQMKRGPGAEQFLDAGPSRGALLNPGDAAATRVTTGWVDDAEEVVLGREHLGEELRAARRMLIAADDAGAVVIIDGQGDLLGHGRSPVKTFSAPEGQSP